MSDRKEFQTARDAGLKQRHEQRLARSAHYNEAVKAAAVAIGLAFNGDPLTWRAEAEAAVEAALPHLRAYQVEVQTRIGFLLGRKETAEEIAAKAEEIAEGHQRSAEAHRAISLEVGSAEPKGQRHMRTAHSFRDQAAGAWEVAHAAREIGTKGNS